MTGKFATAARQLQRTRRARPIVNPVARTGRNEPCPCASGKKFKHCCGRR